MGRIVIDYPTELTIRLMKLERMDTPYMESAGLEETRGLEASFTAEDWSLF